ncbi:DNA polymerase IV [Tepidamorphus sp. 3E244]|uniref:DNA polymerase IV n=1 Tax=Tepidamorphus sp. 3E244 TaxID=3385498 RepID=UPI0038FC690B
MPSPTEMQSLCRNCGATGVATRCASCGSARIVRHVELFSLEIAHIDCDAFYAAVEKRDDPSLRDKPVIIGGGRRGVVSTACYVARMSGVRSAMPMFKALAACPDAIIIKPDMDKYAAVGREVRKRMFDLTPLVEPISIDEAFLDLTGTQKVHHATPAETLARFAREIERDVGISVSVGLAPNKFLAKIASDLDKPRGFAVIGAAESAEFLKLRPVTTIPGIGPAMAKKLSSEGYRMIGDIQRADATALAKRHGEYGLRLYEMAHGRDRRRVDPTSERKSVSAETTFNEDISDPRELETRLWRLCEKVSGRMKAAELSGVTVTLKLKTRDFATRTRAARLADPTQLAGRIYEAGKRLLAQETDGTRYRLIGIGLSDLRDAVEADPTDLADPDLSRKAGAERAVDAVRARFGRDIVQRGLSFAGREKAEKAKSKTGDAGGVSDPNSDLDRER